MNSMCKCINHDCQNKNRVGYETPEMVFLKFEAKDILVSSPLTGNDNFTLDPGENETIVDGSDGWD